MLTNDIVSFEQLGPGNKKYIYHFTAPGENVFRYMIRSDQDLHCPLTELFDTTECMNGEQLVR